MTHHENRGKTFLKEYTHLLFFLLFIFFTSCSDPSSKSGSGTDVECMVGTVVDLSGTPQKGIKAFCYDPEYLPYQNDTTLYESIDMSDSLGKYWFKNFNTQRAYSIVTIDADTNLAGFRKVDTSHFVVNNSSSGYISGEDTVYNVESCIPKIEFSTSIPLVMQVKGTPFYTYLEKDGKFDQELPHGVYDFHLSFPQNPDMGVFEYKDIPVPFINDGAFKLVIPDTTPPNVIANAVLVEKTYSSVAFDWPPVWDNSAVGGYEIKYYPQGDTSQVDTVYNGYSQMKIENLQRGTTYEFWGRSVDLFGNYSDWVGPAIETTDTIKDSLGPVMERPFIVNATSNSITLNWYAATDYSGVKRYLFWHGESEHLKDTAGGTFFDVETIADKSLYSKTISDLKADTRYTIMVVAEDNLGYKSSDLLRVYAKTYK